MPCPTTSALVTTKPPKTARSPSNASNARAACTYAPSTTVDWEFMDDMTVDKMRDVVDKLRKGEPVKSTRGPEVQGFRASERAIAGMDDGAR